MKVTFRVFDAKGNRRLGNAEYGSSSAAWRGAESTTGNARATLKQMGWRVKRHVDVSDSEEAIVVAVAEEVIGPKKVGLIRGLGKLFGL